MALMATAMLTVLLCFPTMLSSLCLKWLWEIKTFHMDNVFGLQSDAWLWVYGSTASDRSRCGNGPNWPRLPGHPFYQRLNRVLEEADFDRFCESRCQGFYHENLGLPSLPPKDVLPVDADRLLRGDRQRARHRLAGEADSLSLRQFLQIGLDEHSPDHVTISRTRRLMDELTHQEVFAWVLRRCGRTGPAEGQDDRH